MREDEVRHHEELARFAEQHRAAWQVDVEERRRLDKMVDEKERFAAAITSRRSSEFEALKARRCAAAVLQRTPARRGSTEGARLCGRENVCGAGQDRAVRDVWLRLGGLRHADLQRSLGCLRLVPHPGRSSGLW